MWSPRQLKVIALTLMAGPGAASADVLGVYGGIGLWQGDFDGDIIADVSADDVLNIDSDTINNYYVGFEHPIPLIPNIKLAHTGIKDSARGTVSAEFMFEGMTFERKNRRWNNAIAPN